MWALAVTVPFRQVHGAPSLLLWYFCGQDASCGHLSACSLSALDWQVAVAESTAARPEHSDDHGLRRQRRRLLIAAEQVVQTCGPAAAKYPKAAEREQHLPAADTAADHVEQQRRQAASSAVAVVVTCQSEQDERMRERRRVAVRDDCLQILAVPSQAAPRDAPAKEATMVRKVGHAPLAD